MKLSKLLWVCLLLPFLTACQFHQAAPNLYWGSVPNNDELPYLKKFGIKSIINFRTNGERGTAEVAKKLGINMVHIKTGVFLTPEESELKQYLSVLCNPDNLPTFVCCNIGIDRTSYYVGAYRIAMQGWTSKQVRDEMLMHNVKQWWWTFMKYDDSLRANEAFLRRTAKELNCPQVVTASNQVCPCIYLVRETLAENTKRRPRQFRAVVYKQPKPSSAKSKPVEIKFAQHSCSPNANLEEIRSRVAKGIKEGQDNGRLTPTQSKCLLSMSEYIDESCRKYAEDGFSYWEKRSLLYLWDQLERSLNARLANVNSDNLQHHGDQRLSELKVAMSNIGNTTISSDYARFANRLAEIERQKSVSRQNVMDEKLDTLERDFYLKVTDTERTTRFGPLDNRFFILREKIDYAIAVGALSKSEAAFVNSEFMRLRQLEDRWSTKTGRVTPWEFDTMARMIALLSGNMDVKMPTRSKAIIMAEAHAQGKDRGQSGSAKYLWYPSRHGGYIELTGQINGVLNRDDLSSYGGVMFDGTPISSISRSPVGGVGRAGCMSRCQT